MAEQLVADELVDEVDDTDRPIGQVTRSEMRRRSVLHRSVGVLVRSTDGQILIQRRAMTKDLLPGWWDVGAGGVVGAGETYDDAARRELAEELGVVGVGLRRLGCSRFDNDQIHTFMTLYEAVADGPFHFSDREVDEAFFVSTEEFGRRISTDRFMPDALALTRPFVAAGAASRMWADALVEATVDAFGPLSDAAKAEPMQRYMKGIAPFVGLPAPLRRAAQRAAWSAFGQPPDGHALGLAARQLAALPQREYSYAACDVLSRWGKHWSDPRLLTDHVEPLLSTRPWWDTVDGLIGAAVEPIVRAHPETLDVVERWSESGVRWLTRAAILHQLHSGPATDSDRLFRLCARHGESREFFIAKAIGWALRTHARHEPDLVRSFVAATRLQPLSKREALKHLGP